MSAAVKDRIIDPMQFKRLCWPSVAFYRQQRDIIYSVRDNRETVVPAGNGLGKDFVSAFIALWFFCSRRPARVVTTSVKYDQLNDVLWGEIRRFLDTCKVKLPITYNHLHVKQVRNDGRDVPLCELVGQVVNKGESLLGRHLPRDIPRTLAIFDEASGIDSAAYESVDTWAHRILIIGNPYPCSNFFYKAVKAAGTVDGTKVIRIKAEDSPNVRLALAEIKAGKEPSNRILVPGVVDYATYQDRRKRWDAIRQCIGLDAEFYEGVEELLFPPDWLNNSETLAAKMTAGTNRGKRTLGVDSAAGGDKTAWAVCDSKSLLELISKKTPNTAIIPDETIAIMKRFGIEAEDVYFDVGGGGKQHADILRARGFKVNTVAFGDPVTPEKRRGVVSVEKRKLEQEEHYAYKNRRAQLYGLLSRSIDPKGEVGGFAIPAKYDELRRQLSVFPRRYDAEGRLVLPPKNKRGKDSREETLVDLLGRSPDEADALVLAHYGHYNPNKATFVAGVIR